MNRKIYFAFIVLFGCRAGNAYAQTTTAPACVKISGEVTKPLQLCMEEFTKMQQVTVSAKDRGGASHDYSGVPIGNILRLAGVTTGKELRGEHLAKYLLVTSSDNYQVVFSLAELDSSFTDRVVILADKMDGKPLPSGVGPFRMIVPGEKKPARSSFQVVALAVLFAKEKE